MKENIPSGPLTAAEVYYDLKEKNQRTGAGPDVIAIAAMELYHQQFQPPSSTSVQVEELAKKMYPVQMDSITNVDGNNIEYDYNEELRAAFKAGLLAASPKGKEEDDCELIKKKLYFYREQTDKVRELVFSRNDIGEPCQPLYDAIFDKIVAQEKEIERLSQLTSSQTGSQPSGMQWVKTNERLPDKPGRYFIKTGRQFIPGSNEINQVATFTSHKEWYLENHHHSRDFFYCTPHEWLDETTTNTVEEEAVELPNDIENFLYWAEKEGWVFIEVIWIKDGWQSRKTNELYSLFKQSKDQT